MNIAHLRTIAQAAQTRMAHTFELFELGTPPQITPGMVDAILQAADGATPRQECDGLVEGAGLRTVNRPVPESAPVTPILSPAAFEAGRERLVEALNGNGSRHAELEEVARQNIAEAAAAREAELEAIIARLRELAVDGTMPSQAKWNIRRGAGE